MIEYVRQALRLLLLVIQCRLKEMAHLPEFGCRRQICHFAGGQCI